MEFDKLLNDGQMKELKNSLESEPPQFWIDGGFPFKTLFICCVIGAIIWGTITSLFLISIAF